MVYTMQDELNLPFTYNYKQPEEYHFSLDSIHLAKFVAKQLQSQSLLDLENLRVLDLCAGCGVIGIELLWHLQAIRQIDFIEIQDIYTECFQHNMKQVNRPEVRYHWHVLNYDELHAKKWECSYDLIISNPPYFHPGHGMLSPSKFKNRCRFYLDSSFQSYIRALENSLAPQGKAYFLLRPLAHHGLDLFADIQKMLLKTSVIVKKMSPIRGTDIILLEKR
jgi:tRNA1Val (adenine37-N6)-methyltransferase